MRFIIRNNHDVDGITEEIVDLINDRYGVEYGAVFDFGDKNRKKRDDVDYFSYWYCTADSIQIEQKILNYPIPRHVLDEMVKYKSMALNMVYRESNYNIYKMAYLENFYYERLHFWYYFLKHNQIDFVLFLVPAHHAGEFILYSLCEVLSIKKLVLYGVMPGGTFVPASRINELGSVIVGNMTDDGKEKESLNRVFSGYAARVNETRTFSLNEIRKIQKDVHMGLFSFVNYRKTLKAIRRLFLIPILPRYKGNREYESRENKRYLNLVFQIIREEHRMDHLKDYHKFAVTPDLTQRYIYFPLQQEPEDTTMPRAGEFKNQFLTLSILSEAARKLNLKIYVKEHWVQEHREKGFYKRIVSMGNVELVDISFNSCELIKHSVAVASQTGSSIMEAMLLGKNSLIFGEGCPYIGMPGSSFISDVSDVCNALTEIMSSGIGYTEQDRDRYMLAYQKSCIDMYCDSLDETQSSYVMKKSAERIVDCIEDIAEYGKLRK